MGLLDHRIILQDTEEENDGKPLVFWGLGVTLAENVVDRLLLRSRKGSFTPVWHYIPRRTSGFLSHLLRKTSDLSEVDSVWIKT